MVSLQLVQDGELVEMGDGVSTEDWEELGSGDDEVGFELEELSVDKAESEELVEIVIIKREALSEGEEMRAEEVKEEDDPIFEEEVTVKEETVSEEGSTSGADFEGVVVEELVSEFV